MDEIEQPDIDATPEVESQGQDDPGLYDLSTVPDEYREHVAQIAKQIDGNVTRKFQEAAEYRKQWEPLEQLGIKDVPVEDLEALLQFNGILDDEEQFDAWLRATAQQRGILDADDDDYEDDDEQDPEPQQINDPRLDAIYQDYEARQQEQRVAQVEQEIKGAFEDLHKKYGDFPEETVARLALSEEGTVAEQLAAAVETYQQIVNGSQKALLDKKADQPDPPEQGGRAAAAQPALSFSDPALREQAKQRLHQTLNG